MSRISRKSLLGLCLFFFFMSFLTACHQPQGEEAENPTEKPVPVKVVEIGSHDLLLTVESVGRVAANREVTLSTEVGGVVKDYFADVGDRVKTEQPLVSIDPLDYRLALREAQANLAAAQARLEAATKAYARSKALLPKKAISLDTFDKYEAEYKSCKAALSQI
ncbi:MAG: biotin/lipoyl-binding protein, partial [Proteobacteria bacterium]|nr:biotin/lipoyl-binding protein [Pseudomonadota bacterium]